MAATTAGHRGFLAGRHLHHILMGQRSIDLLEQVGELRTEARIYLDDLRRVATLVDEELDVEEAVVEADAAQDAASDLRHRLLRGAAQLRRVVEARETDAVRQADRIDDADARELAAGH